MYIYNYIVICYIVLQQDPEVFYIHWRLLYEGFVNLKNTTSYIIRYNILVSEYCINILPFPPLPLESRSCWETGLIFARICGTQGCTGFSITETRATAEGFGAVQSCKIPINEWCVLWYVWKCQYLVRIQKFIIYIYI